MTKKVIFILAVAICFIISMGFIGYTTISKQFQFSQESAQQVGCLSAKVSAMREIIQDIDNLENNKILCKGDVQCENSFNEKIEIKKKEIERVKDYSCEVKKK